MSDFRNADELFEMGRAVRLARTARVSAASLIDWGSRTNDAQGAPHIREALKARFDADTWAVVREPLDNGLLDGQREALVAYVLGKPQTRGLGIGNLNQLYEYLLIDVGLTAGWRTSRVREATASVQLFVQRILLNLENGISPAALDSECWKWMSRYRVWEANRRVFVYPENFLEPELRQGKTQLFRQLEAELQQGEVTARSVEAAYRNYLRKLGEIARLEVVAQVHEAERGHTHVLGRTADDPPVYYYRRWEGLRWTPWERVPLDIPSDQVALHVLGERLFLYWTEFTQATEDVSENQRQQEASNKSNTPAWVVALGHSELRDGEWSPKRVSTAEKGSGFHPTGKGTLRLFEDPLNPIPALDGVYASRLSHYRLVVEVEPAPFQTTARGSGTAPSLAGRVVIRLLLDVSGAFAQNLNRRTPKTGHAATSTFASTPRTPRHSS